MSTTDCETTNSAGPRFSIIPGDFVDDNRATLIHYQVLTQLGRRTNRAGWCVISQTKLARHLGVCRQAVNRAIRDLVVWGYVEKKDQTVTRRNICFYRVILDRGDPLAAGRQSVSDSGVESIANDDGCIGGLSPTDDRDCRLPTTPVSSPDDTSVASREDTITYPLNNVPPPTTKRAPDGARGRGGRMFDSVFEELRSAGHSDAIDHFLVRVTDALEVRHRNPQGLFTEIARAFSGEKTATIARAAEVVIADRAVLMAPKNATEALAKAKQLQLEAKANRSVGITITKSDNPQQWAAWCRAANAEPQRYATIRKIIDIATECIVPTAWPPSAGS